MKFESIVEPRYKTGDIRVYTQKCWLPQSYIVINRETNERNRVTYWLESIEIQEKYAYCRNKYGLFTNIWKLIRVNGQVVE